MSDMGWPAPSPRHEVYTRVLTRGRRLRLMNRILTGLSIGAVVTAGAIGAAIALGTDDEAAPPTGGLTYHACPEDRVAGELSRGDRIFLTGRTEDGAWVELRAPTDGDQRVWMPAAWVVPDEELGTLGVVEPDCAPVDVVVAFPEPEVEEPGTEEAAGAEEHDGPEEMAEDAEEVDEGTETEMPAVAAPAPTPAPPDEEPSTPGPSPEPSPSPSPGPSPSPTPPPSPSPSPTPPAPPAPTPPPPDEEPPAEEPDPEPVQPTLTFVSRSNAEIREAIAANIGACDTSLPTTSEITVEAKHPSGVAQIQIRSRVGSGSWTGWSSMNPLLSGPADRYRAALGPYDPSANGIPVYGQATISWEARVTPVDGPTKVLSSTSNNRVELHWCDFA
jgi:hypothetical protein